MYLKFDTDDLCDDPKLNQLLKQYAQIKLELSSYFNQLLDLKITPIGGPQAKEEE